MSYLSIDIETYSDRNLKEVGMYKYASSPHFEVLIVAYAFDDEPVTVIDLAKGETPPKRFMDGLLDPGITKTAFNAQFERVCLNEHFKVKADDNWECTMIKAWSLGFNGGLEDVGKIVGVEPDQQKLMTGKNLIRLFSIPRKLNPKDGQMSMMDEMYRIMPDDRPADWERFKEYCAQDVVTERAIRNKLERFETLKQEWLLYRLDQKINDIGVKIDLQMVQAAITIDSEQTERLTEAYQAITGLDNPNSLTDLKNFIKTKTGKRVPSITKNNIQELKDKLNGYEDVLQALEIRERLSKTSVSKYRKMVGVVCSDGRAKGLFQFYGASRTGRWAGRLIQLQNLPQNHIKDLDTARKIINQGSLEFLEMMYDSPSDILSECIRTAIIPTEGHKFIVSDFSAIEARVIAWLAGEKWRLDVFDTHGKIYEASAAAMFKVPIESIHKGDPLRQKGKISELALGYQGGPGALISMGAIKMGLTEEELPALVKKWRLANTKIVRFWYDTENAVMEAIENRSTVRLRYNLKVIYQSGILFIELPSGRRLSYVKPKITDHDKFPGKKKILFEEIDPKTYQWKETDTYGGKLVENIVQATARDCLAHSMVELDKAGYKIVMHVHDEIVTEVPKKHDGLKNVTEIMGRSIPWAKGLPLRADGYVCDYYQKD